MLLKEKLSSIEVNIDCALSTHRYSSIENLLNHARQDGKRTQRATNGFFEPSNSGEKESSTASAFMSNDGVGQ